MYLAPFALIWFAMDYSIGPRRGQLLSRISVGVVAIAVTLNIVGLAAFIRARRHSHRGSAEVWVIVALILGALAALLHGWELVFRTDWAMMMESP